ncbi:MAG: A24 family peptidase [Lachnospiraceae bacterium]|nr:A24 family peptidase [Lachnospiraceae bacterium]
MIQIIVAGIFLLCGTYTDLRYGCVYRKTAAAAILISAAGYFVTGKFSVWEMILSLIPGMLCLFISFLTQEGLGYGDSIAIAVCGFALGLERIFSVVVIGFFLAAVWGIGLCIFRKAGRKMEFPFLPFLTIGYVIEILF